MNQSKLDQQINQCLSELGFKSKLLEQYQNGQVSFSILVDQNGNEVSAGSGNGTLSDSKSVAECIEHFFFDSPAPVAQSLTIKQICSQKEFSKDGVLILQNSNEEVPVTEFIEYGTNNKVFVPTNYISPVKNIKTITELKSLCSSSGFSFHQSKDDALLHGLLEVIERHEFSNLLLNRQNGIRICTQELPQNIKQKITDLETCFNGKIEIIVVDPNFISFTTVAIFYPNTKKYVIPQTAQKANFSLKCSIHGALSELEQILSLYSSEEYEEDLKVLNKFKNTQIFDVINLDKLKKTSISKKYYTDNLNKNLFLQNTNVTEKIKTLTTAIATKEFSVLYREVYNFKNGLAVTQIFIPGFEKFNLTRLGLKIPVHGKGI